MTSKEYLSQAYHLDQRINSKIEQISSLNELSTKCTSTITGMPHSPNKGTSKMADTVAKIVDLENEINRDIDRLVDLKHEITTKVNEVPNHEYRTLLEMRYICMKRWDEIAMAMGYELRYLYKLHSKALIFFDGILNKTLKDIERQ